MSNIEVTLSFGAPCDVVFFYYLVLDSWLLANSIRRRAHRCPAAIDDQILAGNMACLRRH
jgi:hypothetical protein